MLLDERGESKEVCCAAFVNCAGPMAAQVHRLSLQGKGAQAELPLRNEIHAKAVLRDRLRTIPQGKPSLLDSGALLSRLLRCAALSLASLYCSFSCFTLSLSRSFHSAAQFLSSLCSPLLPSATFSLASLGALSIASLCCSPFLHSTDQSLASRCCSLVSSILFFMSCCTLLLFLASFCRSIARFFLLSFPLLSPAALAFFAPREWKALVISRV